jgi:hypothetical protein
MEGEDPAVPEATDFETIHVPDARLVLALAKLNRAVHWLRGHDVSICDVANWFVTSENHAHQLSHRGGSSPKKEIVPRYLCDPLRSPLVYPGPSDQYLRTKLGIRSYADSVVLDAGERRGLEAMEAMTDAAAAEFWAGVPFEQGINKFENILRKTRRPVHHRRIRLRARLRQLIAETHLHAGRSASAIVEGLKSLHLYRIANHELPADSKDKSDLENVGRSARLISQAYLLRHDPACAKRFLDMHAEVSQSLGKVVRPEYYHQMGTVALQHEGQDEAARIFYRKAEDAIKRISDYGETKKQHEIWDIGRRHLNLLEPVDWPGSQEVLTYALEKYPVGDIHHAINVNWTAACGFCTDSNEAHVRAIEILNEHPLVADGFGHQATTYCLLRLAQNLAPNLRGQWARFVLYENALRDA